MNLFSKADLRKLLEASQFWSLSKEDAAFTAALTACTDDGLIDELIVTGCVQLSASMVAAKQTDSEGAAHCAVHATVAAHWKSPTGNAFVKALFEHIKRREPHNAKSAVHGSLLIGSLASLCRDAGCPFGLGPNMRAMIMRTIEPQVNPAAASEDVTLFQDPIMFAHCVNSLVYCITKRDEAGAVIVAPIIKLLAGILNALADEAAAEPAVNAVGRCMPLLQAVTASHLVEILAGDDLPWDANALTAAIPSAMHTTVASTGDSGSGASASDPHARLRMGGHVTELRWHTSAVVHVAGKDASKPAARKGVTSVRKAAQQAWAEGPGKKATFDIPTTEADGVTSGSRRRQCTPSCLLCACLSLDHLGFRSDIDKNQLRELGFHPRESDNEKAPLHQPRPTLTTLLVRQLMRQAEMLGPSVEADVSARISGCLGHYDSLAVAAVTWCDANYCLLLGDRPVVSAMAPSLQLHASPVFRDWAIDAHPLRAVSGVSALPFACAVERALAFLAWEWRYVEGKGWRPEQRFRTPDRLPPMHRPLLQAALHALTSEIHADIADALSIRRQGRTPSVAYADGDGAKPTGLPTRPPLNPSLWEERETQAEHWPRARALLAMMLPHPVPADDEQEGAIRLHREWDSAMPTLLQVDEQSRQIACIVPALLDALASAADKVRAAALQLAAAAPSRGATSAGPRSGQALLHDFIQHSELLTCLDVIDWDEIYALNWSDYGAKAPGERSDHNAYSTLVVPPARRLLSAYCSMLLIVTGPPSTDVFGWDSTASQTVGAPASAAAASSLQDSDAMALEVCDRCVGRSRSVELDKLQEWEDRRVKEWLCDLLVEGVRTLVLKCFQPDTGLYTAEYDEDWDEDPQTSPQRLASILTRDDVTGSTSSGLPMLPSLLMRSLACCADYLQREINAAVDEREETMDKEDKAAKDRGADWFRRVRPLWQAAEDVLLTYRAMLAAAVSDGAPKPMMDVVVTHALPLVWLQNTTARFWSVCVTSCYPPATWMGQDVYYDFSVSDMTPPLSVLALQPLPLRARGGVHEKRAEAERWARLLAHRPAPSGGVDDGVSSLVAALQHGSGSGSGDGASSLPASALPALLAIRRQAFAPHSLTSLLLRPDVVKPCLAAHSFITGGVCYHLMVMAVGLQQAARRGGRVRTPSLASTILADSLLMTSFVVTQVLPRRVTTAAAPSSSASSSSTSEGAGTVLARLRCVDAALRPSDPDPDCTDNLILYGSAVAAAAPLTEDKLRWLAQQQAARQAARQPSVDSDDDDDDGDDSPGEGMELFLAMTEAARIVSFLATHSSITQAELAKKHGSLASLIAAMATSAQYTAIAEMTASSGYGPGELCSAAACSGDTTCTGGIVHAFLRPLVLLRQLDDEGGPDAVTAWLAHSPAKAYVMALASPSSGVVSALQAVAAAASKIVTACKGGSPGSASSIAAARAGWYLNQAKGFVAALQQVGARGS